MLVAYSKFSAEMSESQRNFALRVYYFIIDYGKEYNDINFLLFDIGRRIGCMLNFLLGTGKPY